MVEFVESMDSDGLNSFVGAMSPRHPHWGGGLPKPLPIRLREFGHCVGFSGNDSLLKVVIECAGADCEAEVRVLRVKIYVLVSFRPKLASEARKRAEELLRPIPQLQKGIYQLTPRLNFASLQNQSVAFPKEIRISMI